MIVSIREIYRNGLCGLCHPANGVFCNFVFIDFASPMQQNFTFAVMSLTSLFGGYFVAGPYINAALLFGADLLGKKCL